MKLNAAAWSYKDLAGLHNANYKKGTCKLHGSTALKDIEEIWLSTRSNRYLIKKNYNNVFTDLNPNDIDKKEAYQAFRQPKLHRNCLSP